MDSSRGAIGDVEQTPAGEERSLDALLRRRAPAPARTTVPSRGDRFVSAVHPDAAELVTWMAQWLAERVGVPPHTRDPRRPIANYGLDSIVAVELAAVLKRRLGIPVDATLAWEHPTLEALAGHLARAAATRSAAAASQGAS